MSPRRIVLDVYPPEAERPAAYRTVWGRGGRFAVRPGDATSSGPWGMKLTCFRVTETPLTSEAFSSSSTPAFRAIVLPTRQWSSRRPRAGGARSFPGWEFYAPIAESEHSLSIFCPRAVVVLMNPRSHISRSAGEKLRRNPRAKPDRQSGPSRDAFSLAPRSNGPRRSPPVQHGF